MTGQSDSEFQQLLKEQQRIGDAISKGISNFKKANTIQKAKLSYVEDKIVEIQELFSNFETNNKKLLTHPQLDRTSSYFEVHYFDSITSMFDQGIVAMLEQKEKLTKEKGLRVQVDEHLTAVNPIIGNLIKLQRQAISDFKRKLHKMLDKPIPEKEHWLDNLKVQLSSIKSRSDDIFMQFDDADEIPDDVSADAVYDLESELIVELSKIRTSTNNNSTPIFEKENLMKVKLMEFNGDFLKWPVFKNMFTEMVHNKSYSDTMKMVYLHQLLTDEAASVLGQADLTQESYNDTWKRIQETYDNKRRQTTAVANRFFNQPSVKEENALAIKQLFNVTKECLVSLKALGITLDASEPLFVILLLRKIDDATRQAFENKLKDPKENPSLEEFLQFLENRFQALESMDRKTKTAKASHVISNTNNASKCLGCEGSHKLFECKVFKALDLKERWNFTKKHKICALCLHKGHFSAQCKWKPCPKSNCGKKHNSLLHNDEHNRKSTQAVLPESSSCHTIGKADNDERFLFLGTAMVKAEATNNKLCTIRAILDTGSQMNIITEACCRVLGLKPYTKREKFNGVGGGSISCDQKVNIKICSNDFSFTCRIEAFVVPKITSYKPKEKWDITQILKERNLSIELADPKFNNPHSIDMLLDAQVCVDAIHNGKIKLGENLPTLVSSSFGWIVMGKLQSNVESQKFCGVFNIPKLWDVEEPKKPLQVYSKEDKLAMNIFDDTTKVIDGRLTVHLPKQEIIELGESYSIAKTRFSYLEKRLSKNEKLYRDYVKFMQEYQSLGHMVETNWSSIPKTHFFLPHHPVFKDTSSTTKVRVVFDASAKSANNISLNEVLLKGPTVQDELFNHLIRFRFTRYAMCGDLEKMYRQIKISEADQYLQLILWRTNPLDELKIFKLCTITYGTKPAPFLATNCLNKISDENIHQYPLASAAIRNNFYVDDCITGADDIETAMKMQVELINLFSKYGFRLRKWCANSERLLENIPDSDKEKHWNLQDDQEVVKTLGLIWNPYKDSFLISCIEFDMITKITKRVIASEAGQIFDPLGLVQPTVVLAKIMLQRIWSNKLDWDEELPKEYSDYWHKFRNQLPKLNLISVKRHVVIPNYNNIELHGFSDASEKAYGAVIYVRSTNAAGQISVNILCSKSKVAPLSKKSIAKLELCGARLLVELMDKVKNGISYQINATYYWCDSKIVLAWIKNPSSTLKTFVGNRVSIIQELSHNTQWFHISGSNNPADVISRGLFPEELLNCSLWFSGPLFLSLDKIEWPIISSEIDSHCEEVALEFKKCTLIVSSSEDDILQNINHRNSMKSLQHIFGYILRFIENCKLKVKPSKKDISLLSVDELDKALKKIIYILQRKYELHKDINKSLKNLTPFIDSDGLLRVGGRLHLSSSISFNARHPLIIPSCNITKLLLVQIHYENYHAGPQTLLSITRQRFWPLNGKRLASQVFHECIRCFRTRPKDIYQLMGYLPEKRVSVSAPFTYTGVDFAGPFTVHQTGRGNKPFKIYLAVFVCFTVKAVHLELVSELTSKAFIACLRRFISRRGKPVEIFSDNATNFVGAREELKLVRDFITDDDNLHKIQSKLHEQGIKWSLIPARSPHFGGLWEAAVKRAKFHIKDIVNSKNVTYEELLTIITEVEAVLNSRPLTANSDNPNDLKALTPFDFLIQGNFSNIKETNTSHKLTRRWEVIDAIRQEFWQRWVTEYLHTQQQKQKWTKKNTNIKEGSLVILKDSNTSPLNWKLGKIEKAYVGSDNLTRVVDVKTSTGIRSRAVTQVCPLPEIANDDREILDKLVKKSTKNTNTNINNNTQTSSSNNAVKKSKLLNHIISIFVFVLLIFPILGENVRSKQFNVIKFESHPGIYYDGMSTVNIIENKWHLLMYYNMSNYWSQCTYFSGWLDDVKKLCTSTICEQTIFELQQQINDIKELNQVIRRECQLVEFLKVNGSSTRHRRGAINAIGNVANALFGVLDNEYAEKVEQSFSKVVRNEIHMMDLIRNQTLVIDATTKVTKKNNEIIQSELNMINSQITSLTNQTILNEKHIEFNGVIAYISLVIQRYRETQLRIHKALTQFKMGKIDALLISPEEFEQQLKMIQYHVSSRFKLPSFHFEEMEKVVEVAVVHGRFSIIFQVEIPLLNINDFKLYKMFPVPTVNGNDFVAIKPSASHLAINTKANIYYLLSEKDMQDCMEMKKVVLCSKHQPIHDINAHSHCEVKIFLQEEDSFEGCNYQKFHHSQVWFELNKPNQWLYALRHEEKCKLECEDTLRKFDLVKEGLITIKSGCKFVVSGTTIYGKETFSSDSTLSNKIVSKLIPLNLTIPNYSNLTSKPLVVKLNDVSSINQLVENIKFQEPITIEDHFIKTPNIHDCLIYILTALILVGIFFVITKVKTWISNEVNKPLEELITIQETSTSSIQPQPTYQQPLPRPRFDVQFRLPPD